MKTLQPLYNYATNSLEFNLRDSLGHPITIEDGERPVIVCRRQIGSTQYLFRCDGDILDSTTGHVRFQINYTDSTHDSGPVVVELRIRGGGKDRVVGQFESYIAETLTEPSFHSLDYSPRYDTHIILTGEVLATYDSQDLLEEFDLIFVDAQSYHYLEEKYKSKAIFMFNIWAFDKYEPDVFQLYDDFQATPSQIGGPNVQNSEGSYLYQMTESWMLSFYLDIVDFIQDHSDEIAGVFLQDFYPDMGTQWFLENGDDLTVWSDRTDVGGNLVPDFFETHLQTLEGYVRNALDAFMQDGILVVGGTVRQLASTRRLSEDLGDSGPPGHEELLVRLEDNGDTYPDHYIQENDLLQVNPYDSTGAFGQWVDNDYGKGGENFVRASHLALYRNCSLGAGFGETPLTGWTKYSLIVDPKKPRWFYY